ncbi:MAG: hypothetical protein IT271_03530 [Chitinophagales bacterium]|nr:hypothetical protein [Chitinophagales bacterium]
MKIRAKYGTITIELFLILFLISCKQRESAILFDEPQPSGVRNLNTFPKSYQGIYIDKDSSFLRITPNYLISEDFFLIQIHKSELDSLRDQIIYKNGKIIYPALEDTFIAKEFKDSIYWKEVIIDTIIRISEDNIVRKYKGYVVLNSKVDSSSYAVSLLKLEKRKLSIKQIDSKEDLVNLKPTEVTTISQDSIKNDTLSMKFHLTKNEFKGILKIKDFSSPMIYYKIK